MSSLHDFLSRFPLHKDTRTASSSKEEDDEHEHDEEAYVFDTTLFPDTCGFDEDFRVQVTHEDLTPFDASIC